MNAPASLVSLHLSGEEHNTLPDDLTLDTLPGKFTLTRTAAALTAYGGLEWWAVLKGCYERLRTWLAATAPQLETAGEFLRRLARQTTEDPAETLLHSAPS